MSLPFPTVWRVDLPSWVSIPPVTHGSAIVARVGDGLHAVDARDGKKLWHVKVDPGGGSGHLLHAFEDVTLTDRRPDPAHLTEVVAVRDGKLVWTLDLGCIVEAGASAIAAGMLYVVGNAPSGMRLRGFDLATRKLKVDAPLDLGGDALALVADRFLILNRTASPGLYWVKPDGAHDGALEQAPAQEMRVDAGRVVAALRLAEYPERTVQVRDLASGRVLWTAPAHGPVVGLDGDAVVHYADGKGDAATPVLRDAATGKERWRAADVEDAAKVIFAGAHVFLAHMTGVTVVRRADGAPAGEIGSGRTAQLLGERLYLGGFKFLACVTP